MQFAEATMLAAGWIDPLSENFTADFCQNKPFVHCERGSWSLPHTAQTKDQLLRGEIGLSLRSRTRA